MASPERCIKGPYCIIEGSSGFSFGPKVKRHTPTRRRQANLNIGRYQSSYSLSPKAYGDGRLKKPGLKQKKKKDANDLRNNSTGN